MAAQVETLEQAVDDVDAHPSTASDTSTLHRE
jgi:hypothetical protein